MKKTVADLKKINLAEVKNTDLKKEISDLLKDYDSKKDSLKTVFEENNQENISDLFELVESSHPDALLSIEELEKKRASTKKKKLSPEQATNCQEEIDKALARLEQKRKSSTSKPKGPKTQKRVSTVVSDNLIKTISGAIGKEDDVKKIKVSQLLKVKTSGKQFLKDLRNSLGGIADDSDNFIKRFESRIDAIIKVVETKQKDLKE